VSLNLRRFVAAACALIPIAFASSARADASSWFFVGGGPIVWKQGATAMDYGVSAAMQIDVGVGTTPDAPFIVGGLFRLEPIFGSGADLGLLLRGATKGFQAGGFGVAVDAGGYARFWGDGSGGFQGGLTIGAPLGITLCLLGSVGSDSAKSFGVVAGIDFLRLTVYRQSMLDVWTNPLPAQQAGATLTASQLRF
jgi:hypothetical protein